jgi:sulfur carrier protein
MNSDHDITHTLMTVTVNGDALQLPAGATVMDAARALGVAPPFAAAVNLSFVPRTLHGETRLTDGDTIELISPIAGG